MKRKTRIIASVLLGLVAAALTCWYTMSVRNEAQEAQREAMASYGGDVVRVCVATRDIEPGEAIDESNVGVEDWVSSLLPSGAYTSVSDIAGKAACSRIPKRAVLSPAYFETSASALDVPAGMVAVSVASDAEHALGGTLERGDTVDIYISKDAITDRLVTAQVLDTSALQAGGGEITWVTLAVEPERVCELLSAASKALVTLAVSNGSTEGAASGAEASADKDDAGSGSDAASGADAAADAGTEDNSPGAGEDAATTDIDTQTNTQATTGEEGGVS